MFLEENGGLSADLDIVKWEANSNKTFRRVIFGSLEKQGSLDFKFMIRQNATAEMERSKKVELNLDFTFLDVVTYTLLGQGMPLNAMEEGKEGKAFIN